MGIRDRIRAFLDPGRRVADPPGSAFPSLMDLPLHDDATDTLMPREVIDLPLQPTGPATTTALVEARTARAGESIPMGGMMLDPDDSIYRRLSSGAKFQRRDLNSMQQDRMLEIAWYLWEQNPFANRLIKLKGHLVLGAGIVIEAADPRISTEIDLVFQQLAPRILEFFNALCLNGEWILPVGINEFTGRPTLGFVDPYQVKDVQPLASNVLVPDVITLKSRAGEPEQTLKVIRQNPDTGRLEGNAFYFAINRLPNSMRGRSDLMPLADWLDLYDQYLFAEVERLHLLSAFVWDYKIDGADEKGIAAKLAKFPTPKPGSVFAHNEKESLDARTPDLKAQDRSEAGRMLRTHIAGSFGFPLSYIGEIDSNRSTIEGQNDVLLKSPEAAQKEFVGMLDQIVHFAIASATAKNPALFADADRSYKIRMPEIQAKDVARVGGVLASVVAALDTAMANKTASRKVACQALVAMLRQLGIDSDPMEILADADLEADERTELADAIHEAVVRQRADATADAPVVHVVAPVAVRRESTVERDPDTRLISRTTTIEIPIPAGVE